MPRCPNCGEPTRRDRDRQGARCRYCREPLYEDPIDSVAKAATTEGSCPLHRGNAVMRTCERCGNYLCAVCRTRWRDRVLCPACVERSLEAEAMNPRHAKLQWLHSILSLVFGIVAWGASVLAMFLIAYSAEKQEWAGLAFAGLLIIASPLPAVVGLGLATSAVRARGNHLVVATGGLVLDGLHVGVVIGVFCMGLWQT